MGADIACPSQAAVLQSMCLFKVQPPRATVAGLRSAAAHKGSRLLPKAARLVCCKVCWCSFVAVLTANVGEALLCDKQALYHAYEL